MSNKKKLQNSAKTLFVSARKLALEGKYIQAIEVFDQTINADRCFARAYFERGACYYKVGQYHRATDDFDAATVLGYETAQLWSKYQNKAHSDPLLEEQEP